MTNQPRERRCFAVALAASIALAPQPVSPAVVDVSGLDGIAIVTDAALERIARSLLPVRYVVDGTGVTLDGLVLCPATSEHDLDVVAVAALDGSPPLVLPNAACTLPLSTVATFAAASATALAPWRAAVRIHVAWNEGVLTGTATDLATATFAPSTAPTPGAAPAGVPQTTAGATLAASPAPSAAGSVAPPPQPPPVPDSKRLREIMTAAPLFQFDTRRLIALAFSGKTFALQAVPKFESHRIVVELMRDLGEAGDRSGWETLEADAGAAVPPGSDAVFAATHPFLGRTLAEAFATPVEVYRAQDHVITVHDVRETGTSGDVKASGEAVDTVSGISGKITGEYAGTGDLTLQRVDVVAHEHQCSFVDLGCVANNIGLRVGSGALARQIMIKYGNSPLRPTQPIAFPVDLQGRTLDLTIDALQTRSTASDLRIAGRMSASTTH